VDADNLLVRQYAVVDSANRDCSTFGAGNRECCNDIETITDETVCNWMVKL
jgi:hypothetical protein